jgi:hypothetical protein
MVSLNAVGEHKGARAVFALNNTHTWYSWHLQRLGAANRLGGGTVAAVK